MMERIALVSCVKSKLAQSAPAGELYCSPLFRAAKRYAERNSDRWLILSAQHGLLAPDASIEPYEMTLNRMRKAERMAWAEKVLIQLDGLVRGPSQLIILAGSRYREGLLEPLQALGHSIDVPMQGLSMGRCLQWLNTQNSQSSHRHD